MRFTWKEANFYDYRFEYGFNVIPIKEQQKKPPLIRTKKYQSQQVSCSEISTWFKRKGYGDFNLGIMTGQISRLAVLDVDDISLLPALLDKMPEIGRTTAIKTPSNRAHFYFSTDKPMKSTDNFLDMGIELKGEGYYVLAPLSVVNGIPYLFRSWLDHLQPFPERFLLADVKPEIKPGFHLPQGTATQGASCIYQIADRDLAEGERDLALYVEFNLLLQNGNSQEYVKEIIRHKNKSLSNPLSDKELEYVWKKKYTHSCPYVRETLSFIKCDECKFNSKRWKMDNLLLQNIHTLPELSSSDVKVLTIIQTHFDGEQPSISKLSRVGKIDWQVTKDALGRLKKKGILK